MIDLTSWPIILAGAAALTLLATTFAWWLSTAPAPGGRPAAGIVGGVAAGLLLGATLMGRLTPTLYEHIYPGGAAEGRQLDTLQSQQVGEIALLQQIGATEAAIVEQRALHERELEPILAVYDHAISVQSTRWTIIAVALACAWFLAGAVGASKRSRRKERSIAAPIAAGIGSALVAGLPTFLLARWLLNTDIASSTAFACAVGAGGILTEVRTRTSGQAGRSPGVDLASVVALALAALIVVNQQPEVIALAAAGACAIVLRLKVRLNRHRRRLARGVALGVLLPAMTALALAQIDVIALARNQSFWVALVIAAFLASDGRWLGGWLGWWSLGGDGQWRQAWRRSAAAITAGAGGSQVAIALVALSPGAKSSNLLAASVLAALLLELVFPLRRRIAITLDGEVTD